MAMLVHSCSLRRDFLLSAAQSEGQESARRYHRRQKTGSGIKEKKSKAVEHRIIEQKGDKATNRVLRRTCLYLVRAAEALDYVL